MGAERAQRSQLPWRHRVVSGTASRSGLFIARCANAASKCDALDVGLELFTMV